MPKVLPKASKCIASVATTKESKTKNTSDMKIVIHPMTNPENISKLINLIKNKI
jgi:hypothetical protein